jgi:hypothetical protein
MEFNNLFDCLKQLETISKDSNESWINLTFVGLYNSIYKDIFISINLELDRLKIGSSLNLFINDTYIENISDFIEDIQPSERWKVSINKSVLQNNHDANDIYYNFFFNQKELINWIKSSDPFAEDHPFNKRKYLIIVFELKSSFGGPNFIVSNNTSIIEEVDWDQYDESLINDTVHIISNSIFLIKPHCHYISFGEENQISRYFYRNSILVLLASLCNEIYSTGEIILKGYRRISLSIGIDYCGTEISSTYQNLLVNAVKWIYQKNERCDLRLKLFLERVTLDIDYKIPYIQGLYLIIENATIQAKERYSFIIYDRKDLFQKELKDLLKDIKSLTDSFSTKVRGLLGNFLRDVLAAFVLIGITLFSKVSDIKSLFANGLIKYVFLAFGVYYIFSSIIQLAVDSFDIIRSCKEFSYWKLITREYMSKEEFLNHRRKTLNPRLVGSCILYFIIFILYIGVGIICINLPHIWPQLIK